MNTFNNKVLILCLLATITASNNLYAEEPTKEETIKYISQKLEKYGVSYQSLSFNERKGEVRIKLTLTMPSKAVVVERSTIKLSDLNPNTVEAVDNFVHFECTDSSKCIKRSSNNKFQVDNDTAGNIFTSSPGVTEGIAKALKHLITLYGGKEDLF